ncbi:dynein axonemal intermediate chain 4-like [Cotesia glomerata]|nr:dynein axonemal intermediate chain 4-like [Cotesia glomerata]
MSISLKNVRLKQKSKKSDSAQKRDLRIYDEEGNDVTPRPLVHEYYARVEDPSKIFNWDALTLKPTSSSLEVLSSVRDYQSSSSLIKAPSLITTNLPFEETMESLMSICTEDSRNLDDADRAPSPFCLPSVDPVCQISPEKMTILLRETETFFLFDMPQLTADLDTPEGQAVKEANERYEYITKGEGSNRRVAEAETQTTRIYTKSRSTYLGRKKRTNKGTFVNNWVLYDAYNSANIIDNEDGENTKKNLIQSIFSKPIPTDSSPTEDPLSELYKKDSFASAARIMERIIASKFYIVPQKRFKGLIKKDPCDLDLEFTYSLDLLWTHVCPEVQGRPVNCIRWSYKNSNLLAAGYGSVSEESNDSSRGLLLIWCIKNPSQPDRVYKFDSAVSDCDWSRQKPNQLAVGFYDGTVKVIDVSSRSLRIIRKSSRESCSTYWPHWQVQWWLDNDPLDPLVSNQELIYSSNQDGSIFCFDASKDFSAKKIMTIPRIEDKIPGIKRTNSSGCLYDVPISKNPGVLLLRQHPTASNIYYVGSDEGCVYRCSTNYLSHHLDNFLAHNGPFYSLEFSPFCPKIFLTCGADWSTRIWADGITDPLLTLSTSMACVQAACWSPSNSTVIATCVGNEINIWDLKRRTHRPTSVTVLPTDQRLMLLEFTKTGNQLVAADLSGKIFIYNLEGMPFPPFEQTMVLVEAIEKSLTIKPELLKKLRKLGSPF